MKKRKGNLRKRILAVLLAAVLTAGMVSNVAPVSVSAQTASGSGWTLDDEGTLTITTNEGTTAWKDSVSKKAQVKKVVIQESVTEIGESAFDGCLELGSIEIPNNVTSIGQYAFQDCSSLKNIEIPNGVTTIGDKVFYSCNSLRIIRIKGNVTAIGNSVFENCYSLMSIEIPNSVETIGESAFNSCSSLTAITIPNGVTEIGNYAFQYCDRLKEVTMAGEVPPAIGTNVFGDCPCVASGKKGIHVPAGKAETYKAKWSAYTNNITDSTTYTVTVRGGTVGGTTASADFEEGAAVTITAGTPADGKAFDKWVVNSGDVTLAEASNSTTTFTMPAAAVTVTATYKDQSTNIASGTGWALDDNGKLTITSYEGMWNWKNNGNGSYKTQVKVVNIQDGVTEIANYAFSGCSGLTSIMIPASMKYIGNYAFENCSSLESITIPDKVTSIGAGAFSGCSSLAGITIPEGVMGIASNAFSGCSKLENIAISEGVTSIGQYAFEGCSSLTNIKIPDSVTSIEDLAFDMCSSLKDITIPKNVTSIGNNAFNGCSSLASVTMAGETPPTLGTTVFASCPCVAEGKQGIHVPAGKAAVYKAAETWSDYAQYITDGTGGTAITVPAGGKVEIEGGKELMLPNGGTVDADGNVEADIIISGDITVTAPEGGKVTADKAGTITVPEGGTVQSEGGEELTLPDGGTVDKDEKVEAEKITSGETTVTAPAGGKVTADKAGTITVPAGGTVQTGDEEAVTLPGGGTVDTDGTITEWSFEGSGTAENPYQIKTEEDLQELAELVKSGKDPKKAYYKMEAGAGITLTEKSRPWTPIGTAEHPFTGTFDGDGKTIKGLEISGGEPKDNQGLFGVNAGTIENLTVEGSVTGKDNVGGIAGTNTRTGTIKDCTSNVSVTGYNGIGGAAGKNDGTVTGCTNQGSVTGSGTGAGGIAGTNSGTAAGNTNSGSVSGKDSVGGIVGTNGENGKITDNVNSGNVAGDNTGSGSSTIGAVIGKNDNTNLAEDITGNYYQKTDGVNKDLTGIGGTADTAGITSGSSPEPGGTTPGGTTPGETKPGGTTPGETKPGGDKPGTTPEDILSDLTPEQKEKVNQIAKELNVPVETAKKLQEMAQELGIETDTLLLTDKDIVNEDSEEDVKGSAFSKLQAKAVKAKKNSITLKWSKVKGADGYQVYAAKCGKSSRYKLVQTIKKAGATSYTYKKLKKGTAYKFIIKAYKNVDGKKYTIAASKTVHAVTDGGKKTNPKSVKVNKSTVKIRKGKKFTIKPKLVKASSKKKLANHRKIAYESTNKEIATVSKKGVIRGMEKGTCYIYVYAENGIYKKVKVTVK